MSGAAVVANVRTLWGDAAADALAARLDAEGES